jgi:hypothetical protein
VAFTPVAAPVTAIIGMEVRFYEKLPRLFPHADAKAWFNYVALRKSSLQGRTSCSRRGPSGGDPSKLYRRSPRLAFEEACRPA